MKWFLCACYVVLKCATNGLYIYIYVCVCACVYVTFSNPTFISTNLAKQVKVGHEIDQSYSVQSYGFKRAHQCDELPWRSLRTNRRFPGQFWEDCLYLLYKCEIKTKAHLKYVIWRWSSRGQLSLRNSRGHYAEWVIIQLTDRALGEHPIRLTTHGNCCLWWKPSSVCPYLTLARVLPAGTYQSHQPIVLDSPWCRFWWNITN